MDSRSRTALRSPSSWLARAPSAFAAAAASVCAHQRVLAIGSPLKKSKNNVLVRGKLIEQRALTSIFTRHLTFRVEVCRILEPGIEGVTRHCRISTWFFFLSLMVVSPAAAGVDVDLDFPRGCRSIRCVEILRATQIPLASGL